MRPHFPHIELIVDLEGPDGNAFFILANTIKQMRRNGVGEDIIKIYEKEAKSNDYDHLIKTTREYIQLRTGRTFIVLDEYDYEPTIAQQIGDRILNDMEETMKMMQKSDTPDPHA